MTVYVVSLIFVMFVGLIAHEKTRRFDRLMFCFVSFAIVIGVAALRKYSVGIDLDKQYYALFYRVSSMSWQQLGSTAYDYGYCVFNKIVSLFTNDGQWMIASHAFLVFGISGWFIYRHSEDVLLSTFLFIANNTWFMYMNIMRQSLAICFVLVSMEMWISVKDFWKKIALFLIFSTIAMSLHSSAIVVLAFPFIAMLKFERKHIILSSILATVSFFAYDKIFALASTAASFRRDYADFYAGKDSARSILNFGTIYGVVFYVVFFLLGYYYLVYKPKRSSNVSNIHARLGLLSERDYSTSFLMFMILFLIISRVMAIQSIILGRIAYYFIPYLWILVPRTIGQMNNKTTKMIFLVLCYMFIGLMFVWRGSSTAGILYGTVPYIPFWK